jgi:SagB-type dehydrogenase family enzyme
MEATVKESRKQPAYQKGIGDAFQKETKYTPQSLGGHFLDWEHMPERYKSYPDSVAKVSLPDPQISKGENIWEVFFRRRSERDYSRDAVMSQDALSSLLWATQGITAAAGNFQFRSAPSAGGLYPIETYLLVRSVGELEKGFYHFRPLEFDLEFIKPGDFGRSLAEAALGQGMVAEAQVVFIWTAVVARSKWKYRQRAYRYIYLDAGHIAQNLYLAGTAAGIGVCGIGAFFDDQVNSLIGVDGTEETALYLASTGYPAGRAG